MTSRILPYPPQAAMLSALACAFEIVAANRDVLPESTSVVIFQGSRMRLHIQGREAGWTLEERKARVAKVAERLGLTDDRGDGLSFSNSDRSLSVFTVADGPNHIDRQLAEQREGIARAIDELADRFAEERPVVANHIRIGAQAAREFRLEVES